MNSKTLGILALIAAAVLAVAFWFARGRAPSETAAPPALKTSATPGDTGPSNAAGAALFPALASRGNDITEIRIQSAELDTTVKREGGRWVVPARGNYPADAEKVRDAVLSIAELTIAEPKTQKAENFPLLGVQEPGDKDSTSRLVTFSDAQGAVLASLVIGNAAPGGGSGAGRQSAGVGLYVRRAGESQAFEGRTRVDPRYALDPDPGAWIKKSLDGVPADRIKSIDITHADGSTVDLVKAGQGDADFAVANIPAGREVKYAGAASAVAQAVAIISFDNVKPIAEIAQGASPTGTAVFRTFDGLVLTVDTSTKDGTSWVTFGAKHEVPAETAPAPTEDVRKEAAALNSRFSGWAFALPAYRVQQLLTKMDDLLKPASAPAPAGESAPGPILGDDGQPVAVPDK